MPQKIIIVLDGLNVSFLNKPIEGLCQYKKGMTELARLSEDITADRNLKISQNSYQSAANAKISAG